MKFDEEAKASTKAEKVTDSVEDLRKVQQKSTNVDRKSENRLQEPSAKNGKNTMVVLLVIIILIAVVAGVMFLQNRNKPTGTTEINTEVSSTVTDTEAPVKKTDKQEGSTEENPNAIYDDKGEVISTNGIYDTEGNVISDDEDVIDAGLPTFDGSGNNTTTAIVYSESDFIKDLNGVDVPAVYNVKSRDYVKDFVNYEAKRAIIDEGMELYWLEVTYSGKKYRVQVPFYVFKDLDKTGICIVELEVLTLEGGEKIVSYMQVITDYSNLDM